MRLRHSIKNTPNNEVPSASTSSAQPPRDRRGSTATLALAMFVVLAALGLTLSFAQPTLTSSSPATAVTSGASGAPTPTPVPVPDCPAAGCPTQLPPTGDSNIDPYYIYVGAVPPGSDVKPVLLFVHGLTGIAQDWWTNATYPVPNDMYLDAYNGGYRTAFVTLQANGQRGPDGTMWTNGPILAQQIKIVAQYYGVQKLDIVAHSKGGVDAQTAIVWNGTASLVDTVFMLSTPNLGSPLADYLCTSPPPYPITPICTMTPSYMSQYRKRTDPLSSKLSVRYWVAGGTDHSLGVYAASGALLSKIDPSEGNDGFVPVSSATTLQGSQYLFVRPYSHPSIRQGSNTFPFIQAVLQIGTPASTTTLRTSFPPPRLPLRIGAFPSVQPAAPAH